MTPEKAKEIELQKQAYMKSPEYQAWKKGFDKFYEKVSALEAEIKKDYEGDGKNPGLFESWRGYATKEGLLFPKDYYEFYWWYLGEKHPDALPKELLEILRKFTYEDLMEFHEWHKAQLKQIKSKPGNKINATHIGRFCWLVNEAGIIEKGESSIINYCKKVCEYYGIKYPPRARLSFTNHIPKKQKEVIVTHILPSIPEADQRRILAALEKRKQ